MIHLQRKNPRLATRKNGLFSLLLFQNPFIFTFVFYFGSTNPSSLLSSLICHIVCVNTRLHLSLDPTNMKSSTCWQDWRVVLVSQMRYILDKKRSRKLIMHLGTTERCMRVFCCGAPKKSGSFLLPESSQKRCFKAILAWWFCYERTWFKQTHLCSLPKLDLQGRQAGKRPNNLLGVRRQLEKKRSRTDWQKLSFFKNLIFLSFFQKRKILESASVVTRRWYWIPGW
jgi:hypothetical protein